MNEMDRDKGFNHFWGFVRHPKWRLNELPWQQWTLVCEVVVEGGKGRLDKWSLMGSIMGARAPPLDPWGWLFGHPEMDFEVAPQATPEVALATFGGGLQDTHFLIIF